MAFLLAASVAFSAPPTGVTRLATLPVRSRPSVSMVVPPPLAAALVADVASGGIAAVGCAPLVACVDQAITLSASGDAKLWPTLGEKIVGIVKEPINFFSSAAFIWLWFVYALTYAVSNSAATISRALGISPILPVLVASTAANMGASIAKDAAFARMLSSGEPKAVPVLSYLAWFGRDVVTMGFVFTLPALLVGKVPDLVCRLSAPVVAQYFTTPFHLLGLAFYNLPTATFGAKVSSVTRTLVPTVIARQFRILPAFSLGGIANAAIKAALMARLVGA